jgi:DNA-3-methyladenine glycosylase II
MNEKADSVSEGSFSMIVVQPYDIGLSIQAIRSFQPSKTEQRDRLLLGLRIDNKPILVEIRQNVKIKDSLSISSIPDINRSRLREIVEWILFSELKLSAFYKLATGYPKIKPVITRLHGLKPMRPVSLFEMAVTAITEQQISLAAANTIKARLIQRFGESIGSQWIFPEPQILAKATPDEIRLCGYSIQKVAYIHDLATSITNGTLNLDSLKTMADDRARETIMALRGFGRWSADYMLVRGLARADCVPADDLAIQRVIGQYLGDGQRASSLEVTNKLEPFRPYRGLLAYYLLADSHLNPKAIR